MINKNSSFGLGLYQEHKYNIRQDKAALEYMEAFIKKTDIGRLALNGNDYPYVIPMAHIYHSGHFYYHCAFGGKKLELIKNNAYASYVVDGPIKPLGEQYFHHPWISVISYGTLQEIKDTEEKFKVLKMYGKHYSGFKENLRLDRVKTCNLLVLNIEKMTGRYGKFTPAEDRKLLLWDFRDANV